VNILDEILVRTTRSRSPYHVYQTRSLGDSIRKNHRRYPRLHRHLRTAFYNDGALFSQISDALGQRFVYRITEDLQR
jgi:hypothetical protein